MKNFIAILATVMSTTLYSQSTLIEYNFQTEEYSFYKIIKKKDTVIQKEIKKPFSYRGIPTKIVIKGLNTFYYDVNFTAESHEVIPINGDQSVQMLAENFTSGVGAFGDLIGEVKSNDIYQSLFVDGEFQGMEGLKGAFGMAESEFQSKMERLAVKGEQLEMTQGKIKKASNTLKSTFDRLLLAEFVNDQMIKLQQNKNISPEEMQERAEALIRKILIEDVSLEAVIDNSENNSRKLADGYSSFKSAFIMYEMQHNDLMKSIEILKAEIGEEDFLSIVNAWEMELKYDFTEIENNLDALNTLVLEHNAGKIREDYLTAFENYDQIAHADFNFEYSVNTDLDATTLTMEFVESNSSLDSNQALNVIKTRKIEIPTVGGLRINSSAGMSFIRFMNGQQTYSSNGGTIREIEGDAFLPSLTTMFHFYKQTYRPIAIGGSFGVGVPIEGDKEFIYMLGTSLIFGQGQRVIFNFGGFGGKTESLNGMKVGDSISDGTIVPTKKVFDFGVYAGITLNINKLF